MLGTKEKKKQLLIIVFAFQFIILVGMYLNSLTPLYFGKEIKVQTLPVDPRSMFRGHYVRLPYTFSQIKKEDIIDIEKEDNIIKSGDYLYISLKEKGSIYEMKHASIKKPDSGIFIRGRIQGKRYLNKNTKSYDVKYNIEAFFAPKNKAIKMQNELRHGGFAVLKVLKNGKVAIENIIDKKVYCESRTDIACK